MIEAKPKISTLIVTYNTGAVVLDCIDSILSSQYEGEIEVIVCDNQSTDSTPDLIRENYPHVKLLISERNGGFSYGNNLAFQQANGDVIALINPDLRLQQNTLSVLVDVIEKNTHIGVVGPRTLSNSGEIEYTARPEYTPLYILLVYFGMSHWFPRLLYRSAYNINRTIDIQTSTAWLQGSCLVCRREVYEVIDGMDENFFLYSEDTDFCDRIRQQNLEVVYVPSAVVTHLGGTSTANASLIRVRGYHISPLYYFRKRQKHLSVLFLKLVLSLELLGKSFFRTVRNLFKPNKKQVQQAKHEVQVLFEMWKY